jgi:hypothetical protein
MSEIKVNKISPKQTCTQLTLGDSGDTIIIPAGATITNNGTATGFGATGAVNWDTTKKTSGFTAVSGVGYFCDTTSTAFTVTLPATPSAGAIVAVADYANTFATNNLTIGRNGSNIGGSAINAVLSTNGVSVTLVYVDATQGWVITDSGARSDIPQPTFIVATGGTITTCGNFKIHTFTGPGTFTVSSVGNPAGSTTVDYLVVAGGGSGGMGNTSGGSGAGAGGLRISSGTASGSYTVSPLGSSVSALPVSATGYPITVGAGGSSVTAAGAAGNSGNPSTFSSITSAGGGKGSGHDNAGSSGGSGAGGTGAGPQAPQVGYAGNTPPVSPPQGNPGGTGANAAPNYGSAGGGGAGTAGSSAPNPSGPAGPGGDGIQTNINGTLYYFSGGGGGGSWTAPGTTGGNGGLGGGGGGHSQAGSSGTGGPGLNNGAAGGPQPSGTGGAGGANTGGGGGAGTNNPGTTGAGGSGIVVIRYKFQ